MSTDALKLAVFDCDGTLVDSQHGIIAAMHAACEAHGFERPGDDAVRGVVGLPLIDAIARVAPEADSDELIRMRDAYADAFRALRARGELEEPLFPGAVDALDALEAEGWLLGVATGKSRVGLLRTLEAHGLEKRFITLKTSDDGPGKPNPHILLQAMNETGAEARNTVMIGDTTFDILMAGAAKTASVGVSWGYHPVQDLHDAGADVVVDAFDQAPGAVARLVNGGR